jgi:type III secretion protein J
VALSSALRSTPMAIVLLLTLPACARDELLHGLDEKQANEVLLALDEGGVHAEKRRDDASEGAWRVDVARAEAPRARQVLAERELPRARPPGFAEVFGNGSVVPTPSEERALYLHALSGELGRSVETLDGVVEARVHLALPAPDPLAAAPAPPPCAAVLVKVRPGARARVEPLAPGLRALVAAAVPGLEGARVSVVIAEASPAPQPAPRPASTRRRTILLSLAVAAALAGVALSALALRRRLGLPAFLRRSRAA